MGGATISRGNGGLGFDMFHALECTHDYNRSAYYADDDPKLRHWDGYDVFAQTRLAQDFIASRDEQPFMLVLSLGPAAQPLRDGAKSLPRHV